MEHGRKKTKIATENILGTKLKKSAVLRDQSCNFIF